MTEVRIYLAMMLAAALPTVGVATAIETWIWVRGAMLNVRWAWHRHVWRSRNPGQCFACHVGDTPFDDAHTCERERI